MQSAREVERDLSRVEVGMLDLADDCRPGAFGPRVAAFFDLDHTLVAGYTALAFARDRLERGEMNARELRHVMSTALAFKLSRIPFAEFLERSVSFAEGLHEARFRALGQRVFDRYLEARIFPEAHRLIEAHRSRGHTIAIISSATAYQVAPIARRLGIDLLRCSRLVVEGGIVTGRIEQPCYGEGKASAARELAQERSLDLSRSYFYTDSDEDLPLLELVGCPRPVNPNRALAKVARERGWPTRRFALPKKAAVRRRLIVPPGPWPVRRQTESA